METIEDLVRSMRFGIETKIKSRSKQEAFVILTLFSKMVSEELEKVKEGLLETLKIGEAVAIPNLSGQSIVLQQGATKSEIRAKSLGRLLIERGDIEALLDMVSISKTSLESSSLPDKKDLVERYSQSLGSNKPSLKLMETKKTNASKN